MKINFPLNFSSCDILRSFRQFSNGRVVVEEYLPLDNDNLRKGYALRRRKRIAKKIVNKISFKVNKKSCAVQTESLKIPILSVCNDITREDISIENSPPISNTNDMTNINYEQSITDVTTYDKKSDNQVEIIEPFKKISSIDVLKQEKDF